MLFFGHKPHNFEKYLPKQLSKKDKLFPRWRPNFLIHCLLLGKESFKIGKVSAFCELDPYPDPPKYINFIFAKATRNKQKKFGDTFGNLSFSLVLKTKRVGLKLVSRLRQHAGFFKTTVVMQSMI